MSDLGLRWLGRCGYAEAVTEMEATRNRILAGDLAGQALLLCEHPPVITLGRSASATEVVAPSLVLDGQPVELAKTNRGGSATYHGPGQLMIYPIVALRRGLLPLLESVARAIGAAAASLGVPGAVFRRDPAGVWIGDKKIAACGIHIRRRVMIHGFALNLSTPAAAWQLIVPCGMSDRPIASITELGGAPRTAAEAAGEFGALLARAVADGAGFALP